MDKHGHENHDDIGTLSDMSIILHEVYKSFRDAGFTQSEALELLAIALRDGQGK